MPYQHPAPLTLTSSRLAGRAVVYAHGPIVWAARWR